MIVSFDISTKFLAYAMFDQDGLYEHGKLMLSRNLDERIGSVSEVVRDKFHGYNIQTFIYENGFLANSPKILMELSKVSGSLIGSMWLIGARNPIAVPPITWQLGIGIGRTSVKDMEKLTKLYKGKSVSWIKNKNRENRKQLIIDYVNKEYGLDLKMVDNDEADAIAMGHYAINKYNLI